MFKELFKLCKRDSVYGKTPLEDFVTDAFVGVLNANEKVRADFLEEIGLPTDGQYHIESQRFYLFERKKSFIDIVIEDRKRQTICFIESKVNSKENPEQLKKYSAIIRSHETDNDDVKTKLVYCTKNYDPKTSIDGRDIEPLRWFEIADLLKRHESDYLIKDFWNFLNEYNMTSDLSLNQSNIEVMRGFKSTIQTFNNYLTRLEPSFKKLFCKQLKLKKIESTTRVLKHDRWIYYLSDILPKPSGDRKIRSDFNYGFYFNESRIYVGLYIHQELPEYRTMLKLLEPMCEQHGLFYGDNIGNKLTPKNRTTG